MAVDSTLSTPLFFSTMMTECFPTILEMSDGDRTRFFLNKQVAFVGKISFCEEKTILGTIKVLVIDEDIDALIDKVAPVTVDGEEVIL